MLARVALFWRCVRYVPRRQLIRRLWLESKRRFIMLPIGRPLRRRRRLPLSLSENLPCRIFEPRCEQVAEKDGSYIHRLLNREFSLQLPIDWSLENVGDTTHLQRLAIHYHECLESLPFKHGRDLVLNWIEQNPPWQPGYWKDCWNSYAISIRCVCWLQWLADHRPKLEQRELEIILGSLVEQVRFLMSNLETDICGNHLIKNIKCLLWAGRCFEGPEAKRWFATGRRLLEHELKVQFLADGMHFELSPAYHCQVFADLLECSHILNEPESHELIERLRAPAQAIADLTHPDGFISLFGDGGFRMAYLPATCLAVYESLGGQAVAAREHFAFHNAGYFGMRTDRTYLVVDCGPPCAAPLPAHGHGDILSFEWDVEGQRVIVDPGVYEYESGARRMESRSARSHNTLFVDGRDQCEFIDSFRVGRRAKVKLERCITTEGKLLLEGWHDGYSVAGRKITHRRTFRADRDCIIITDQIDGLCRGQEALLRFNFAPKDVDWGMKGVAITLGDVQVKLESDVDFRSQNLGFSTDFGMRCIGVSLIGCLSAPTANTRLAVESFGSK